LIRNYLQECKNQYIPYITEETMKNKNYLFSLSLVFCLFITTKSYANNIAIANLSQVDKTIIDPNDNGNYMRIKFDLSWENSWRTNNLNSMGVTNWDAAWVFVKYRVGGESPEFSRVNSVNDSVMSIPNTANLRVGMAISVIAGTGTFAANSYITEISNATEFKVNATPTQALSNARIRCRGVWEHATLHSTGHQAATSSQIDIPSDGKGAFIYRNANGAGNNNFTNLRLRWNYAADGVNDQIDGVNDQNSVDIQVFAIEMVYVPQGAFYVGSGGNESGSFTNGSWVGGATIPFQISSEAPLNIAQTPGSLWGTSSTGSSRIGGAGTLPAAYPKGFAAFYCMKYEISQQQYVNFLNSLTQIQANTRKYTNTANRYAITGNTIGAYTTTNPYLACNYISWMDLAAYLDWSALRPMTELEFEKACRGIATPVANEYAWGNTAATAATGINNAGLANEVAINPTANAVYGNSGTGGPMRIGSFASASSNRIQSGATFYGIMEMGGNLWERAVTVGNADGRAFNASHGNGVLSTNGHATTATWPGLVGGQITGASGSAFRGGDWGITATLMQTSGRSFAAITVTSRGHDNGGRGVRSDP
jgi:formylglycine-generating enzyme required for sulfatase activity